MQLANLKELLRLDFYTQILDGKKGVHPFLVVSILALVTTLIPSVKLIRYGLPTVANLPKKVTTAVDVLVPADLEVTVKNGMVQTNVTEPYYVTVRGSAFEEIFGSAEKKSTSTVSNMRLVAIDTKGKVEDFERYQVYALITESNIVYYNKGNINIYPLRDVKDFTFNKAFVQKQADTIVNNKWIIPALSGFIVLFPLLSLLGAFSGGLISLFFLALPVFVLVKVYKLPSRFWQTYRYTVAVYFLPGLLWAVGEQLPTIGIYIRALTQLLTVVVLVLCYRGILQSVKSK